MNTNEDDRSLAAEALKKGHEVKAGPGNGWGWSWRCACGEHGWSGTREQVDARSGIVNSNSHVVDDPTKPESPICGSWCNDDSADAYAPTLPPGFYSTLPGSDWYRFGGVAIQADPCLDEDCWDGMLGHGGVVPCPKCHGLGVIPRHGSIESWCSVHRSPGLDWRMCQDAVLAFMELDASDPLDVAAVGHCSIGWVVVVPIKEGPA